MAEMAKIAKESKKKTSMDTYPDFYIPVKSPIFGIFLYFCRFGCKKVICEAERVIVHLKKLRNPPPL